MIGDEVADSDGDEVADGKAESPRQVDRRRQYRRRIVVALVTAAAVGAGITAYSLAGDDSDDGREASSGALRPAEEVACAARILEGDVVSVRESGRREGGYPAVTVTLAVKDWLKPAAGPGTAKFSIPEPKEAGGPVLRTGDRVLFEAWDHPDIVDAYFTGRRIEVKRASLSRALEKGAQTRCPDSWTRRQDDG